MNLTADDYWLAACLDTAYEGISGEAVTAACEVSENAEQFFWAVQTAIRLKELINDNTR